MVSDFDTGRAASAVNDSILYAARFIDLIAEFILTSRLLGTDDIQHTGTFTRIIARRSLR